MDNGLTPTRTALDVARELQDGNLGLTISSNVVEYPTVNEAEAAIAELRRAEITAIQAAYAPRHVNVVYSSLLTNVVARVIILTGGRVVAKASAVSRTA